MTFRPLAPLLEWLRPSRRELLAGTAAATFAACSRKAPTAAPRSPPPLAGRTLDPAERRAIEAFAEAILPRDGDRAGAADAGVVDFIDAQLATPALARIAPAVRQTAALLDAWSRREHGGALADLAPDARHAVVDALARGAIPTAARFPQREAFRALHTLVLEGFLSDPVHRGNRNQAGWRAIGFAEPHRRLPGPVDPRGGHHH